MAKPELTKKIQDITEPIAQSMGLCLWGIELSPGTRPLVRIYVDVPKPAQKVLSENLKENIGENSALADNSVPKSMDEELKNASATVEQCAELSRMVGLAMEVEDIFATAYILEVSSPGFSRPFFELWQMAPYVGDTIEISLLDFLPNPAEEFKGRKKFRGQLLHVGQEDFSLRVETGTSTQDICLAFSDLRKASRVHIFTTPEKPGKKKSLPNKQKT